MFLLTAVSSVFLTPAFAAEMSRIGYAGLDHATWADATTQCFRTIRSVSLGRVQEWLGRAVREPFDWPLCVFYSAALSHLFALVSVSGDTLTVTVEGGIVKVDTSQKLEGPPRGKVTVQPNPEGPFCVTIGGE